MFTTARIFAALSTTCTGVLIFTDAPIIPPWLRIVIGAIGLLSGGIVAVSGPVQKNAGEL